VSVAEFIGPAATAPPLPAAPAGGFTPAGTAAAPEGVAGGPWLTITAVVNVAEFTAAVGAPPDPAAIPTDGITPGAMA
jgi:hypothetical protein